ncbi:MAG: hypothetical protein JXK05_03555 [Campylobacterales bacterium]|nr:hypothetical protein [Campylobacterales bacterium]
MSDKHEILEAIEPILAPQQQNGWRFLLSVMLMVILFFAILFPKIYLHNQIYYTSREVAKLKREYDALKEENRLIRAEVESIRFKNQILDTLF